MDKGDERGLGQIWRAQFPPLRWLPEYRTKWIADDATAGVTLAAYAIPVSLAYATLAGLPPQVGIYGYLLGGLGYALLGSSRQLAVGPTSAISLMIAGTVESMADGNAERYLEIATLTAFVVAFLCFIAWLLRLSIIVRLISDSILVGFKAGAGLTIIMTQLPSLFGLPGGGHNFFDRAVLMGSQLYQSNVLVLGLGITAILCLLAGDRLLPGRPIALGVVALGIIASAAFRLSELGVPTTGHVPAGLPSITWSELRLRDVDGIFPLAAGCLLLAYVESISAARTFAAKHGYTLDPRQEFLGIGAANLAASFGHGYPVAGGLSQSAVNDKAGARTPLALIFASLTLGLCLLFFTGFLSNLPKAILAAIVITAVLGLIDIPTLLRMRRISKADFLAAMIALAAVLLLGILQGILLAVLASVLLLLARASHPHVAFLGRVPGTKSYSDMARHPENEPLSNLIAFRPEAALLYINAEHVLDAILHRIREAGASNIREVICDLSASPYIDLAGSGMLHQLHDELSRRGIALRIVGAHGLLRDLLRADGVGEKVGGLNRRVTLDDVLSDAQADPHG
jgi:SulP family sulfate permease